MKKINNIAIVGFGSIGRRHFRLIRKTFPAVNLVLVRFQRKEIYPEEKFADAIFSNINEVINFGIDAAIIASPASIHINHAVQFVKAGIPILIEKPLSNNLEDAILFNQIASEKNVKVLLGYVLRHSINSQIFKNNIENDMLGDKLFAHIDFSSYLPDWRVNQDYRTTVSASADLGGGVLLELSHEIDYANWFFGPFNKVYALIKNTNTLDIDVEDTAELILTNSEGLNISIHIDFCSRINKRKCILFGSSSSLICDHIRNKVELVSSDQSAQSLNGNHHVTDMYKTQILHFFRCVENNETPYVTIQDGIDVLKLINAAKQSNLEERVISL